MWTAVYGPNEKRSKAGFPTKEAAFEYVHNNMCETCKQAFERSKIEKVDESDWACCEAEWFVILTEDYEKCDSFEDILKAAG